MAFNGTGTFNLAASPGYPAVPNTTIESDQFNAVVVDIAHGLENCQTLDGQNSPLADLPMAAFKHTGVGNAAARTQYAAAGQIQDQALVWCGTAGGTADALTLTSTPPITTFVTGQRFAFLSASANTGAATIAVSGLVAKALVKSDGTALVAGDVKASQLMSVTYNGTAFVVDSDRASRSGDTYAGTHSFTDATITVATQIAGTVNTKAASTEFVFNAGLSASVPTQTGYAENYLTTDGASVSWKAPHQIPIFWMGL